METRTRKRIAAGAALLALATLGATLLVACGSGGGSDASASSAPESTLVKFPAATGVVVNAKVGETVTVWLKANATTGYEWTITPGDTMETVKSTYVPDPNPSDLAGSGGKQTVTVKVTKAGTSELTGTYARGWETPTPSAAPDFSMTIVSTD